MRKIFNFCKRYLYIHKWRLFFYVALSIIVSTGAIISPFLIGDFIDQLMNAEDIGFIYRYFIIFAGINTASLILGYVTSRLYMGLQTILGFAINKDFIIRLQQAPINFTSKQDTAYLNQRINNDANALIIFCISILQNVLVNLVIVIATFTLMLIFHPGLTGVLVVVAMVYFTFYALYKKILYRASHAFQESRSEFFSKLYEQLFSIRFIKLHSLFYQFIERLTTSFDRLLTSALNYQKANYIFSGLDKLVLVVAQMVLLLFGGREVIAGRLTIGRFIIISSYFNMMLGAIRYFFGLGQTVQSNLVSYNRLQELAAVELEHNGTQQLSGVNSIKLESVSFAYGNVPVLTNINLSFSKGNIYVIQGPNGAGKSTLADIIMGLQNGNYTGAVVYNGVNMNNINMYNVRQKHIGVSEQEPILLTDTLEYNLTLSQMVLTGTNSDQDRFYKLTKILGLDSYIGALPNHLATKINENAANISGGEKQKLSILRALLKNPDVLVLDEPTSALDVASKASLRTYLDGIKTGKIIVLITHDSDFYDDEAYTIIQLPNVQNNSRPQTPT